jgi:hypothetical protein
MAIHVPIAKKKWRRERDGCAFGLPFGTVASSSLARRLASNPGFATALPCPSGLSLRARLVSRLFPLLKRKTAGFSSCSLLQWRRERDSNPRYAVKRTHAFQACSLNHSDTSPTVERVGKATHSPRGNQPGFPRIFKERTASFKQMVIDPWHSNC